jgi:hypothetical protein
VNSGFGELRNAGAAILSADNGLASASYLISEAPRV